MMDKLRHSPVETNSAPTCMDLRCDIESRFWVNTGDMGVLIESWGDEADCVHLVTDSIDPISPSGDRLVLLSRERVMVEHKKELSSIRYWCTSPEDPASWKRSNGSEVFPLTECQAVVLTTEESDEPVGKLSLEELNERILKYWGGILPTAMTNSRMYTEWLSYFIEHNHDYGVVHAWVGALRGQAIGKWNSVTLPLRTAPVYELWDSEPRISKMELTTQSPLSVPSTHIGNDDGEVLAGLVGPSLGRRTKILENGNPVITADSSTEVRRIWDICANRIIPMSWFQDYVQQDSKQPPFSAWSGLAHISHAWVAFDEIKFVLTKVNNYTWPVPIPKDVEIEDIRNQMLRLNMRYVWLDVLCLRQDIEAKPGLLKELGNPYTLQEIEERKAMQSKEWVSDVPLIGWTYRQTFPTVLVYLNGLGRLTTSLEEQKWHDMRHWLRRAWTMQEIVNLEFMIFPGITESDSKRLLNQEIPCFGLSFSQAINLAIDMNLPNLIRSMQTRFASNPVDRVGGMLYFCAHPPQAKATSMIHGAVSEREWTGKNYGHLPAYGRTESPEDGWLRLVHATAEVWTIECQLWNAGHNPHSINRHVHFADQLLTLFPHPSGEHWFPSWNQLMAYPDVSLREPQLPDGVPPRIECALRLQGGYLYRRIRLRRANIDGIDSYLASEQSFPTLEDSQTHLRPLQVHLYPYDNSWGHHPEIDENQSYVLIDITTIPETNRLGQMYITTPTWIGNHKTPTDKVPHILILCRELGNYDDEFINSLHAAGRITFNHDLDEVWPYRAFEGRPDKEIIDPYLHYRLRRVTTLRWDADASGRKMRYLPFHAVMDSPPYPTHLGAKGVVWYDSWHPSVSVTLQ